MLLDFTVGNYRSFNQIKTLSLRAQGLSEEPKGNVASCGPRKILKTIAIYGANSSGKTNLILSMQTMRRMVLQSVKLNDNDELLYDPFLLKKNNEGNPTFFEVEFIKDDICYRYGFKYTLYQITDEWLFEVKSRSELPLFIRNEDGIKIDNGHFKEGNNIGNAKLNKNRLFVSLSSQLGGEISKKIISWFSDDCNVLSGLNTADYNAFSKLLFFNKDESSQRALSFFKNLKLGFNNLSTRMEDFRIPDELPKVFADLLAKEANGKKNIVMDSVHNVYDEKGNVCEEKSFSFDERESAGTKKLFDLSGPIFDVLKDGGTLAIDELDAKMHPLISLSIITLFNDASSNPKNAQLIFTTHDTNLLSSRQLRRDQIWFTEKDEVEQTDLYNMMDIVLPDGTAPRKDANYEKNYIAGRYGAIPFIVRE